MGNFFWQEIEVTGCMKRLAWQGVMNLGISTGICHIFKMYKYINNKWYVFSTSSRGICPIPCMWYDTQEPCNTDGILTLITAV